MILLKIFWRPLWQKECRSYDKRAYIGVKCAYMIRIFHDICCNKRMNIAKLWKHFRIFEDIFDKKSGWPWTSKEKTSAPLMHLFPTTSTPFSFRFIFGNMIFLCRFFSEWGLIVIVMVTTTQQASLTHVLVPILLDNGNKNNDSDDN